MKTFYFGLVLVGCACFALCVAETIQGNMKEHGWDGPISVDPKTGLLQPPAELYRSDISGADELTLFSQWKDKYCKIVYIPSGKLESTDNNNVCTKDGKDLCCFGYECVPFRQGNDWHCLDLSANPFA